MLTSAWPRADLTSETGVEVTCATSAQAPRACPGPTVSSLGREICGTPGTAVLGKGNTHRVAAGPPQTRNTGSTKLLLSLAIEIRPQRCLSPRAGTGRGQRGGILKAWKDISLLHNGDNRVKLSPEITRKVDNVPNVSSFRQI